MVKRILVAKPGLDGHDRGALFVARALMDAGFEVIYTGLHQAAEQIVEAAIQEDVDLIALSIMSGGQISVMEQIAAVAKERGIEDVPIILGGIIPKRDRSALAQYGVKKVFGPGATSSEIIKFVRELLMGHPGRPSSSGAERSNKERSRG